MSTTYGCSVCSFTSPIRAEAEEHVNASNANIELFQCPGAGCGILFCLDHQTQGEHGHFKNCPAMYRWKAEKKKGTDINLPAVRQHCDITRLRTQMAHVTQAVATSAQPALPVHTAPTAPATLTPQPRTKRTSPKKVATRKRTARGSKNDKKETSAPTAPAAPGLRLSGSNDAPTLSNAWTDYTNRFGPDPSRWPAMQSVNSSRHELNKFLPLKPLIDWPGRLHGAALAEYAKNNLPRESRQPVQRNAAGEEEDASEDEESASPVDTPMQDDDVEEETSDDEDGKTVDDMD